MVSVVVALKEEIPLKSIFCWSDSSISLAWIRAVGKEFKTFVENRVVEIRKNVSADQWYYCRSEVNPADIITRSGGEAYSKMWLNGPDFLYNPVTKVDVHQIPDDASEPPELKARLPNDCTTLVATQENPKSSVGKIIDIDKFNDYLKLLRVTGYVLCFVNNLKAKINKSQLVESVFLNSNEMNDAKLLWFIDNQIVINEHEKYSDLRRDVN